MAMTPDRRGPRARPAKGSDLPVVTETARRRRADRRPQHALAARPIPRPTTAAASPTSPTCASTRDERRSAGATTRRWGGVLEVIPTKADYVLDLIRMNSLWPLLSGLACCAIEMMSAATSQERHGPLGHVPVPGQPAPGRRADRRRHADDQDGRPARPALGADARAEVVRRDGRLHLLGRPLQAQLLDGRGHRPGHAGRRLHPRLPAAAGGPDLRDDEAPAARQGPPRPLAGAGDRADRARRTSRDGPPSRRASRRASATA